MQLSTKEKIIKYILSLDCKGTNEGIQVNISRKQFEASTIAKIGEQEFCKQLELLNIKGLISVQFRDADRTLQYYITITLQEPIINYFAHKKEQKSINAIIGFNSGFLYQFQLLHWLLQ